MSSVRTIFSRRPGLGDEIRGDNESSNWKIVHILTPSPIIVRQGLFLSLPNHKIFTQQSIKMVSKTVIALLAVAESVSAFPWVAMQDGVDSSLFRRQQPGEGAQDPSTCPVNPNHVPAAPITKQYPYNNAINGQKGNGMGGYQVPADGDTAHYFVAPDYSKDIRGPCPGLSESSSKTHDNNSF